MEFEHRGGGTPKEEPRPLEAKRPEKNQPTLDVREGRGGVPPPQGEWQPERVEVQPPVESAEGNSLVSLPAKHLSRKEKQLVYVKRYYQKNKAERLVNQSRYNQEHKKERREYQREYMRSGNDSSENGPHSPTNRCQTSISSDVCDVLGAVIITSSLGLDTFCTCRCCRSNISASRGYFCWSRSKSSSLESCFLYPSTISRITSSAISGYLGNREPATFVVGKNGRNRLACSLQVDAGIFSRSATSAIDTI
jgi:hypothetical protein